MKRLRIVVGVALAVMASLVFTSAAGASGIVKPRLATLTIFAPNTVAESMVVGADGYLYVSLSDYPGTTGRIVKVDPATGSQTQFGPSIPTGFGFLTGLAVDASGNLYVARTTFTADPAPGILLVTASALTQVAVMPETTFPNGLVARRGELFVSDITGGAIWRLHGGTLTEWFQSALLSGKHGVGANGLAFRDGSLYVAVSYPGLIVRIPVGSDGTPGPEAVFADDELLTAADGIVFGPDGVLYVSTSAENRLVSVSTNGGVQLLAQKRDGLLYPTQPQWLGGTLYVSNGFGSGGGPSVVYRQQ